jgi:hypothetical protein
MARRNDNRTGDSKTSVAQVKSLIADGGNRANQVRGDGLFQLSKFKRAKLVITRRERVRMEVKNGSDDPRVMRLDEQMAFEHRQLTSARAESDRAAAPIEAPGEHEWVLHGFVRNQDGHGLMGFKVSLFPDECGQEEPVASVSTGKRGSFRYKVGKGRARNIDDASGDVESENTGEQRRTRARKLYVGVTNPNGELSFIDSRPISIRLGSAVYRDITVQARHAGDTERRAPTRFLGDAGETVLHDLSNEKQTCCVDKIVPDNRFFFRTTDQADSLSFAYCPHCFGRTRSRT